MTKTELQIALAAATQTNKRTAALFLDTLSSLAYKSDSEGRRIRAAGLWKTGKAEEESAYRHQSEDATEDQNSGQNGR